VQTITSEPTVFKLSSAKAVFRIGPMHIPDVIKGRANLSEVLVNCKRLAGPAWYKSLGCRKFAPEREYLSSIAAGTGTKSETRFLLLPHTEDLKRICASFCNSKMSV